MITEEMLKQAAEEAGKTITDSLTHQEEYSHEFSKAFESNMENVLQKAKAKKRKRIYKQVACYMAIFVMAGSSFLMFHKEARATFLYWLKGQYNGYMEYRYTGDGSAEQKAYVLTYLPEGYYEKEITETEGMNIAIYHNDMGNQIAFMSSSGTDAISLFISDENAEEVMVGKQKADYYRAEAEDENSVIVWQSEDGETIFCISANLSQEQLVQIAQSVQEKPADSANNAK